MPFSQINKGFLREAERKYLAEQNQIQVGFIDPTTRKVKKMILRHLTGKTNSIYVMWTYWNEVCRENGLHPKDVVQIWSFHLGSEQSLYLALVVVYRANQRGEEGIDGDSSSNCQILHKSNLLTLDQPPTVDVFYNIIACDDQLIDERVC
jgi:hypothetical protein